MKKLTKSTLNKLIHEELELFLEGEEDAGADIFGGGEEEEAADEGGDDESAAEDTEAEEGGDEGDEGDEGGEEEGDEKESEEKSLQPDLSDLPAEDRAELSKAVDDDLSALLMDFEATAVHSASAEEESIEVLAQESYGQRLKRYLFEGEEGASDALKIDVHRFANDTARLINHYPDLLDMEKLIYNKAKVFLMAKYSKADVEEFEEIMTTQHGFEFADKGQPVPFGSEGKPEAPWPPRAVGAAPPAA